MSAEAGERVVPASTGQSAPPSEVDGRRSGPSRRRRWAVPAALASILIVISMLVSVRVPHTDISLDASADELSLVLDAQRAFTRSTRLLSLHASGAAEVRLPLGARTAARPDEATASAKPDAVSLSVASATSGGSITLAPILAPAGTRVSIRAGATGRYHLSIEPPAKTEITVTASVAGPIEVELAGVAASAFQSKTPKAVTIVASSQPLDLDIHLSSPPDCSLAPNLDVTRLVLARIEESPDAARTEVRRVSSLQQGTLYLDSLNGEVVKLRPGEALQFNEAKGELRNLSACGEAVKFFFSGTVRGMSAGSERHPVDTMPIVLRWLVANQTLALIWSSMLFLFGLWMTVGRWWRNDPERTRP